MRGNEGWHGGCDMCVADAVLRDRHQDTGCKPCAVRDGLL